MSAYFYIEQVNPYMNTNVFKKAGYNVKGLKYIYGPKLTTLPSAFRVRSAMKKAQLGKETKTWSQLDLDTLCIMATTRKLKYLEKKYSNISNQKLRILKRELQGG